MTYRLVQGHAIMARLLAGFTALTMAAPALHAQSGTPPGIPTAQEQGERSEPDAPDPPPADLDFFDAEVAVDPGTAAGRQIAFEASRLSYENAGDIVAASGNVVLRSEDRSLRADTVTWNRQSGEIVAQGNVRLVDASGNQLLSERITLTDEFEAGAMNDLLLVLGEGGRLAANRGQRGDDGAIILDRAAYTGCAVTDLEGCDKKPSWRITAQRVVYDPENRSIRFQGAFFELFGARVLPLPGLALSTDGGSASGFLIPNLRFSRNNGIEISGSYYWRLAPNRDLTASGYLFSDSPPMISGQWRQFIDRGAYQVTGYLTESRRIGTSDGEFDSDRGLRGYVFANGQIQLTDKWSATASIRRASDRTFLRRYDISREDRLRSMVELERISSQSYFSLAGWDTQALRLDKEQGQVPVALPVIDYRKRFENNLLGGTLELQANTLLISRDAGQDTQRAFVSGQWDLSRFTPMGQVVTFSALARGDVYHTNDSDLTNTAIYRGSEGWTTRVIGLAAIDVQWPLVGSLFGGTQVVTPRAQLVATPPVRNLAVPNEDARAIDLEDINLFSLNRFPGYDRFEDGARFTYGVDWRLNRPGLTAFATIGQSVRFDSDRDIFPDGTGLSEKVSDIVGRTELRFEDFREDRPSLSPGQGQFCITAKRIRCDGRYDADIPRTRLSAPQPRCGLLAGRFAGSRGDSVCRQGPFCPALVRLWRWHRKFDRRAGRPPVGVRRVRTHSDASGRRI